MANTLPFFLLFSLLMVIYLLLGNSRLLFWCFIAYFSSWKGSCRRLEIRFAATRCHWMICISVLSWKHCRIFLEIIFSLMDPCFSDETSERRIYIGNIDHRISEATLIKMFSPFGKVESEDFLWHTRGPKRGEPRGYAFIQYSKKEEAEQAKEKMHGRLAAGRPLVVRLAGEKCVSETAENSSKIIGGNTKTWSTGSTSGQMSRTAKIAAIKNKLKTLEEENIRPKKQKQGDGIS